MVRYCFPISKAQCDVRLNGKIKFHTNKSMGKNEHSYVISKRHYFQFDGSTNATKGNFDN